MCKEQSALSHRQYFLYFHVFGIFSFSFLIEMYNSIWYCIKQFMASAASQAGDDDSSRLPSLTFGLQGSVYVQRCALLLVPQWQCISSFVFYIIVTRFPFAVWSWQYSSPRGVRLRCHYAFFLVCCGCVTSYIVSVHIQCQASIYTLLLCRGHSWRVRLAKQETLTPPEHMVSPLVFRGSVNVHRGALLLVP